MIDLKSITKKYPDCLLSSDKLRSYLIDLYPTEKRDIFIICAIFDCGIVEEIKSLHETNGEVEHFRINNWCEILENHYGIAKKFGYDNLLLWCDAFDVEILNYSQGLDISNNILNGIGDCRDENIIIPKNVIKIADNAFHKCKTIKSIKLSESILEIGANAFYDCSNIEKIYISKSLVEIGVRAFENCSSLNAVNIKDLSRWLKINFKGYFSNPLYYAHKLYLYNELITDLNLPDTLTTVPIRAFQGCLSIKTIAIPDSVKNIGGWAFEGLTELKAIIIPNSVNYIGSYAFNGCNSLTEVFLPDSVENLGKDAFPKSCKINGNNKNIFSRPKTTNNNGKRNNYTPDFDYYDGDLDRYYADSKAEADAKYMKEVERDSRFDSGGNFERPDFGYLEDIENEEKWRPGYEDDYGKAYNDKFIDDDDYY